MTLKCTLTTVLTTLWVLPACDTLSLDDTLTRMPLGPARVSPDMDPSVTEIMSELPFDLLNPADLGMEGIIVEADIAILKNEQGFESSVMMFQDEHDSGGDRKASENLWPDDPSSNLPTIPYQISTNAKKPSRIREAISEIESLTCIRFTEQTDVFPHVPSFVYITAGTGCWSSVGRTGVYRQRMSLGTGCYSKGIILHELCHVIGLFHEHSRYDREEHIKVNLTNVSPGKNNNFKTHLVNSHGIPYDLASIMQYDSTEFSVDGRSTIVTLDPHQQIYLGQRQRLTFRDQAAINTMYDCAGKWRSHCTSVPTCLNGGYLWQDCTCRCPPGTSPPSCIITKESYYDTPTCGGNITKEGGLIMTPNYPGNYPKYSSCVWWVKSDDPCLIPRVTFSSFSLFARGSNKQCIWDRLEIRTQNIYYGDEYCDGDLYPGDQFTSTGQDLILFFSAKLDRKSGFRAVVSFVRNKECPVEVSSRDCTTYDLTDQETVWKSPNHPHNYALGTSCTISLTKPSPSLVYLMVQKIRLTRRCRDRIVITSARGTTTRLCGVRTGSVIPLVGSLHTGVFHSTRRRGRRSRSWSLSFMTARSTCHSTITLGTLNSTGTLKSPNFPQKYPKHTQCEWWIQAPEGYKIELSFKVLLLATNKYYPRYKWYKRRFFQRFCHRGYVLVSRTGNPKYPESETDKLCGYRESGFTIQSQGSRLALLFWGSGFATKGFHIDYYLV